MKVVLYFGRKLCIRFSQLISNITRPVQKTLLIGSAMPEEMLVSAIEERHQVAVELVNLLKKEMDELEILFQDRSQEEQRKKLLEENAKLKQEVELWHAKVVELEKKHGIKQYPIPGNSMAQKPLTGDSHLNITEPTMTPNTENSVSRKRKPASKEKKEKEEIFPKKKEKSPKATADASKTVKDDAKDVHVGRLDFRVGRIVSIEKHPDADSLYVEQIDVGEERPRTIVSGLVKFVPIDQMQNRLVVVLCNLKPAKMRGILSEGMVMCASTPEKVEVLDPPENAAPGEQVTCSDFPVEPDALLNPKKKIFEQVAPDLKTNGDCVATYKSSVLKVGDKGVVKANTLVGVQIK